MVTAILEILAALLPLLVEWLQSRRTNGAEHDEAIYRARRALAEGDGMGFAAAAADQHDRIGRLTGGCK